MPQKTILKIMISSFITRLENIDISLKSFLLIFFSTIFARGILETFSNPGFQGPFLGWTSIFLHITVWFISIFIWISILIKIFTKISIIKIIKAQLVFLPIILFAPIFDLITSGAGKRLTYIFVSNTKELLNYFGSFFLEYPSLGLRIEIAIFVILISIYIYSKTKKPLKGILGGFLAYIIIFIYLSFPSLPVVVQNYHNDTNNISTFYITMPLNKNILIGQNYIAQLENFNERIDVLFDLLTMTITFISLFIGLLIIFYFWNINKFKAFFKNIRLNRLLHYWLMFFIGVGIAYIVFMPNFNLIYWNILALLLMLISIACSWAKAVGENDIIDKNIDCISNPTRPLIKNEITIEETKNLNLILFILAITGALIISYHAFIFILFFQIIYSLYSSPPLKLKRIMILNPFLIALASLTMMMLGFFTIIPTAQLIQFPGKIITLTLIAFTLGVNFKDIKDIEGDKKFNIKTIPVVFGEKWGKFIIGSMFFVAFMLVPIILKELILLLPAVLFGGLGFLFINKKQYQEKLVFLAYFLYILSIIIFYAFIK